MDNPSSGLTSRAFLIDQQAEAERARRASTMAGRASRGDAVVIGGFRNAIAVDFAAFVRERSRSQAVLVVEEGIRALAGGVRSLSLEGCSRSTPDDWGRHEPSSLIVFLSPRPSGPERRWLADLLKAARQWPIAFVGIVGTIRVHLDDPAALEAERFAIAPVRSSGIESSVAVFRPSLVLSANSGVSRWVRWIAPLYPLVPGYVRTCFVDGNEFFAVIEAVRSQDGRYADMVDEVNGSDGEVGAGVGGKRLYVNRRQRDYTLLGANLPWRQVLEQHRSGSLGQKVTTAVAGILSWLLVGHLVSVIVASLGKRVSWAKSWSVDTLMPRSFRELRSLCHRWNIERIKVVGYNNGVNHFGHRYPGKTIVSTVGCRRTVQARPGILRADCGVTIHDARDYLSGRGEELYVVPNYSYVALGTSFFVPIHGSAVDYSTVADTVCRVILYDPDRDQIVSASREDEGFRENLYNPRSRVVVLRLYLRIKPKSGYFIRREFRKNAEANEILAALRDREAANVEIRQAHAASENVTISKYYTSPGDSTAPALELPRDALGRLWDRLEENPISSFLMHALSRHVAWHTELFFTAAEFELFWRTHSKVPLRKIQLRYIRRDGMPHSPFRDEDCVSADLFLLRFDKPAFDAYLQRTFAAVRTNPGKHSN